MDLVRKVSQSHYQRGCSPSNILSISLPLTLSDCGPNQIHETRVGSSGGREKHPQIPWSSLWNEHPIKAFSPSPRLLCFGWPRSSLRGYLHIILQAKARDSIGGGLRHSAYHGLHGRLQISKSLRVQPHVPLRRRGQGTNELV